MGLKTANNQSDRSDHRQRDNWWIESYHSNEVLAMLLGGFAAMLLLALISYTPDDLPSWVSFKQILDVEPESSSNFIGPIGATAAGYILRGFGAAGYLIPAILVWWGIQQVITRRNLGIRNFVALALFLISAACIADCQKLFLSDWIEKYDLPGSVGGLVGLKLGHEVFVRFFGPAGSFIIMSVISVLTLIVITGIHPYRFLCRVGGRLSRMFGSVNWEKKWSLWSGITPEEPVQPIRRSLTTSEVISIERVITEDDEPVATYVEQEPVIEEEPVVEEETVFDKVVKPVAPGPERVRKIIDASQRHHQPANEPPVKLDLNRQYEGYQLPPLDVLGYADEYNDFECDDEVLIQTQNHIVRTLNSFKVEVEPGDITKGPTITRYEFYPSPGLRVNKIVALKDDIARATRAERINILAPSPGKDTVGIEIANSNKVTVALRELFESDTFQNCNAKLPLVLGKDVYGEAIIGDLAKMPHLLVAGATGSGKSVCINSIIASLLYRFTPDELKFIMIDPKVVEMQLYNALPHMVVPVVTDPKNVLLALRWVIKEMESRYTMFAKKGVRNFEGFNSLRDKEVRAKELAEGKALQPNLVNTETGEDFLESDELGTDKDPSPVENTVDDEIPENLPYIVVIIDELADLMQTASTDVETSIARIAQKARAAGIHLIIATQTPRADVITGTIKANIPSRIAFQVSSKTDSRIILDENGAENLVGKGDMLYLPPRSAQLIRAQGALITDDEALALVEVCAAQGTPSYLLDGNEEAGFGFMEDEEVREVSDADEEILSKCMEVIFTEKKASTSLLQRKLRLGYTRAARMIDILESRGIIGPGDGARPREILIDLTVD
ncbi:MAG: DNA translocase FtsK [Verrucomicrobiales bacterium]|nr:DNA translocase FtsK [Verrucomicrobiales bacterium]